MDGKFECAPGFVLVRETPLENKTRGGLFLPDGTDLRHAAGSGEVLAVGPSHFEHGVMILPFVAVGDIAYFPRAAGAEMTLNGEKLLMLRPGQVMGRLVKDARGTEFTEPPLEDLPTPISLDDDIVVF